MMPSVQAIAERLDAVLAGEATGGVAGAVVGVAVGDEQVARAFGKANLNTGQPFTEDTGFLLGSVTKVLVTTIVMRLVERGQVDLDAPVRRYVPEFTLRDADAAERITVRMLLNHTNGIDSDTLMPSAVRGRDASRSYTAHLPNMGVLFEPGCGIHYTNPGFVLAGRVIEECTGLPFERAIQEELFDPAGMRDATAVETQAFLRRTAVGAFSDGEGGLRATPMFTLPESGGGAGATPIVTVDDMLTFGRMHLRGGVAPNGERGLAEELAKAMQTQTYDLGIPQAPPIGLGWWLMPIAGTTAPWHGGGSPGGASSFCIVPEFDAAIISFATGPGGGGLNDRLHVAILAELTGQPAQPPLEIAPSPIPDDVAGEYAAFQTRMTVEPKGEELTVTTRFEWYDEDHRRTFAGYGVEKEATATYTCVAPRQFSPAGMPPEMLAGFYGRMALLAALPAVPGRRPALHTGFRYIPKVG
jgi:CubicO group peptidase (beta-lactamase class C family)